MWHKLVLKYLYFTFFTHLCHFFFFKTDHFWGNNLNRWELILEHKSRLKVWCECFVFVSMLLCTVYRLKWSACGVWQIRSRLKLALALTLRLHSVCWLYWHFDGTDSSLFLSMLTMIIFNSTFCIYVCIDGPMTFSTQCPYFFVVSDQRTGFCPDLPTVTFWETSSTWRRLSSRVSTFLWGCLWTTVWPPWTQIPTLRSDTPSSATMGEKNKPCLKGGKKRSNYSRTFM